MCRVMQLFAFFKGLESCETLFGDLGRDLEVVIKTAASTNSRNTNSRGPRSREAPERRLGKRGWSAALAAYLITASISLHVPTAPNPFLDPAV